MLSCGAVVCEVYRCGRGGGGKSGESGGETWQRRVIARQGDVKTIKKETSLRKRCLKVEEATSLKKMLHNDDCIE